MPSRRSLSDDNTARVSYQKLIKGFRMSLSNNLTVCIFAYNEAHRIERCVNNFKGLFPTLVVDNFSEDGTYEAALQLGCSAVKIKNKGYVEDDDVMTQVLSHCKTDYILIATVSEHVPLSLLQCYADVANTGSHDIVRPFRLSVTAGEPIPISGNPSKRQPGELRMFKKGTVSYKNNIVHHTGEILVDESRILNLVRCRNMHFYQFRDYDCAHTEKILIQYGELLGEQYHQQNLRFGLHKAFFYGIKAFFTSYIRFGAFRFGMLGFIHSYYRFHMHFTVWLRVWEWENARRRGDVILLNSNVRAKLEAEFHTELRSLYRGSEGFSDV